VAAATAEDTDALPEGPQWWFEPVFDGQRALLHRVPTGTRIHRHGGAETTAAWSDLAHAGRRLRPGTVLDGAAVVWRDGCLDPAAALARAAAPPAAAAALARERPASYAAFDLLAHPVHGDVRALPYTERRGLLLEVLELIGPPLQPVPATDDPETALIWYASLRDQGVEAVAAKHGGAPYGRPGGWLAMRHADRADLPVVGYTGAAVRPKRLVVRLPDGRRRACLPLSAELAAQAAAFLTAAGPGRRARTEDGEPYATCAAGLTARAVTGPARHAVITVTAVTAVTAGGTGTGTASGGDSSG
jgi:ATP-dependent DNA ligase